MPSHLAPCAQCRHYIRSSELACPFCGAAQSAPGLQATQRMARGAAMVLSTTLALASCGDPAPSAPAEAPVTIEVAPAVEVPVEPAPVEPAPVEPVLVEAPPVVPEVVPEPALPPPPTPAIVRPQPVRPMMARYGRAPSRPIGPGDPLEDI